MDKFKVESQKLMYHIPRVNRWLEGKDIYPIYIEIGPSRNCNYRCSFCAFDYLQRQPEYIDKSLLLKRLSEMSDCGVKSIMYSGEGEPLLHPEIIELVRYTRKAGLDAALTTNGLLLEEETSEKLLPYLSWIRISLNAGTPATYAKIHRCEAKYFVRVLNNLKYAARLKKRRKYNCTIGAQLLLLPQNNEEVFPLARKLKEIGIDYLIIKPYSRHPLSKNRLSENINYSKHLSLVRKLEEFSDARFQVIFRIRAMQKLREEKPYRRCLGLPFWAFIDAKGDAYACSTFLGNRQFCYGNIYKSNFREIWAGKKRKQILGFFAKTFEASRCRQVCRLDEVNRYLWGLKYSQPHINFI